MAGGIPHIGILDKASACIDNGFLAGASNDFQIFFGKQLIHYIRQMELVEGDKLSICLMLQQRGNPGEEKSLPPTHTPPYTPYPT
jgi:hypothetical protein